MAKYYAKEAAKDRVRARGHKLSQYLPKDVTRMAIELLMAEPERFITAAREAIVRDLLRKAQRRTGRFRVSVMRPVRRANAEYRVREHLTETEDRCNVFKSPITIPRYLLFAAIATSASAIIKGC